MTKILFRVDAGPQVGLGHLQRSLSLATALRQFDATSLFLTNEDSTVLDRVTRFGFEGETLGTHECWGVDDIAQTIALATSHRCTAIVVDSDYEGASYLNELRGAGFFVCAIEDIVEHPFPCQLVVNGDTHAHQLPYRSSSGDTLFLLGPDYSILRPEFWKLPPHVTNDIAENILVTLGGFDSYNLMPRILRFLSELPRKFNITAIVGPFFKNHNQIEAIAKNAKNPIRLVYSPDSVCNLMLEADIAVSAGGQTLYELARIGCPTIAVRIAANQDGQLEVFEESGFVRVAGRGDDDSVVNAIGDAVFSLLQNPQTRADMSGAGQRLIDGQGALRVAGTILDVISRENKVTARKKFSGFGSM